jgi:rhamnopyranosyl-N-acetylglucosaminyl-diphospho-decaprenol beta-1,3/1,4-galactofuranosyltransferase
MNGRICVLVVTYNRKDLLLRNLKATLSQTQSVDILIFDNHSNDGTEQFLNDNGILSLKNVHYHYNAVNSGGAGGFCEGMKKAYNMGFDLVWLMDDDGYCYNRETLQKLLEAIPEGREDFILNPAVICDDAKNLTFGFLDISTYDQLKETASGNVYDGYINPFDGTLISRTCMERIGFPKGEFFIYGDEHEYMLRAKKHNVLIRTVVDSLYYHPVNRKIESRRVWKYDIPLKDEPVWKTFCDTRNNIYITRHYSGWKMLLVKIFVSVSAAMLKKEKKSVYLKYTLLAIFDGLRENFSRPIMFNK